MSVLLSCSEQKIRKDACWYATFMFLYLLVNLFVLMRPSPHWDEILDWNGQATDTYLVAGRWAGWMYRMVFGVGMFQVTSGLIAGVYVALALVIQTKLLQLDSPAFKFTYAALYIGCNQIVTQLVYSFQSDTSMFGLLLATVAVYVLVRFDKIIVSALILSVALGMYQSIGLCYLVLWAAVVLVQKQLSLRSLIRFALSAGLGIVVYFLVHKTILLLVDIPQNMIDYVKNYQLTTTNWRYIPEYDWKFKLIAFAFYFRQSVMQAFGNGETFNCVTASAIIPFVVLVWRRIREKAGFVLKLGNIVLLLVIWYAPFALTFLLLGFPGDRVCMAAPLSAAFLWLLMLKEIPAGGKLAPVVLIVALLVVVKAAYTNGIRARQEAYEHDYAVKQLHEMYYHARSVAASSQLRQYEIILMADGENTNPVFKFSAPEYFKSSVLDWYASHYRLHGLRQADESDYTKYADVMKTMPHWPDLNSIKQVDGDIIIRLSAEQE